MRKKIPTLLVIILLLAALMLGFFLFFNQRINQTKQINQINPRDVMVANVTDNSATIVWQTDLPVKGAVLINDRSVKDDRDSVEEVERYTHFVTLTELSPDTDYVYQLAFNGLVYPENPLRFKTVSTDLNQKALQEQTSQPIRGLVLDPNKAPVDEALIVLNLPNALPRATFTTSAGNFILPMNRLINKEQTDTIHIGLKQPAVLEMKKGALTSLVQVTLPVSDQSLSAVTLGKNENLIEFLAQPAATAQPLEFQDQVIVYDLNTDGKINTLDSALVSDLVERQQFNPIADFNKDQKIDTLDLELIKDQLQ